MLMLSCFILNSFLSTDLKNTQQASLIGGLTPTKNLSAFPIKIPDIKYGFALDTFQVTIDTIRSNQFLAELLLPHKVDYQNIVISRSSKDEAINSYLMYKKVGKDAEWLGCWDGKKFQESSAPSLKDN